MRVITNLNQIVSDAANNYILQNEATFKSEVVGPQGPAGTNGTDGAAGVQGITGKSSYDIWIEDGNTGSISDYIDSIKGQQGDVGPDGPQGIQGVTGNTGDQGISVHHVVGTSTTDPEGDFETPGETDTYTLYGDANETINLGYFRITNGDSAYQYAVDGGFTGTVEDFIDTLGMIDDIVTAANNAVGLALTHANNAEASSQEAERWAEELEDVQVEAGKYSAHHWANKAEASSLASAATADLKVDKTSITSALTSTSITEVLSALAGKNLKDAIDAINTLLASDDTTLDEMQEIVDFIKTNKTDLDSLAMDNIAETATYKYFTLAEQTKLGGIAAGSDMLKSTYDTDGSGMVDSSERLENFKEFGIVSGCVFSVNQSNANHYNVTPGVYYIDGIKYEFAGENDRPSVGLAGTFAHVRLTASGLEDGLGTFVVLATNEVALEVSTYAKVADNEIQNTGPSSDNTEDILQDLYLRMKFFEETLFKNGAGKISMSGTINQLDIAGGTVSAPNGSRVTIPSESDIGANAVYNVGGVETIQPNVTPIVLDHTVYDDGTDLATLPTDAFVTHTVLRSVRSGANYLVYGKTVHSHLGQAEAQEPDYGTFAGSEEGSFIEPLALVVVREGVGAITSITDIRGGKEANTIDSIAGKTIPTMVSGDVLTFNGNQIVAQTPASNAGQGVSYFLGNTLISGGNYDLSIAPAGGAEVTVDQTANSGDSPKFIERYVSDALGGTSINAGAWTFRTYASVSANAGDTNVIARINRDVLKPGTVTSTGTGVTRTFTASEPGTFVVGDASASILDATLIQTPGETFFIDGFISDTQVTATSSNAGYVNETAVSFSNFYKLFEVLAAENVTGSLPALYEINSVQPAFAIDPEDKLLIAYFLDVSSGNNKTISIYKNGSENYSHFLTPLLYRHNGMSGLNEGDYQHLTQAEKAKYEAYENQIAALTAVIEW